MWTHSKRPSVISTGTAGSPSLPASGSSLPFGLDNLPSWPPPSGEYTRTCLEPSVSGGQPIGSSSTPGVIESELPRPAIERSRPCGLLTRGSLRRAVDEALLMSPDEVSGALARALEARQRSRTMLKLMVLTALMAGMAIGGLALALSPEPERDAARSLVAMTGVCSGR